MSENDSKTFDLLQIESNDIQLKKFVGKGAFGYVREGLWRGNRVAVKEYEIQEKENNNFEIELKQLLRLSHENIVTLYGFVREDNLWALVMEYAEGGSVYDVLHSDSKVVYSLWHVIWWLLQCARGIAYMHAIRPKPVIHRDLKSLNILLLNGGIDLKICDFGMACDLKSIMSNLKGSLAWMAPEVMQSTNYDQKCDVFSWGVILWELLSRRVPWKQVDVTMAIMYLVGVEGKRLPLIKHCPKSIEDLMTKCWSKDPMDRPSMIELELILQELIQFCPKPKLKRIFHSFEKNEDCTQMESLWSAVSQQKSNEIRDQEMNTESKCSLQTGGPSPPPALARAYSDESLESFSSRYSQQSLKRYNSDGNGVKQNEYISPTKPLLKDFKDFQISVSKELELRPQKPDCLPLVPKFELQKTLYKKYLQLKSEKTTLMLAQQELQRRQPFDANKLVKRLEDQNHSLIELKRRLELQLETIKQKDDQEQDIKNGWEFIQSK